MSNELSVQPVRDEVPRRIRLMHERGTQSLARCLYPIESTIFNSTINVEVIAFGTVLQTEQIIVNLSLLSLVISRLGC